MQALSPTLFPCFAPADRELAHAIAAFLERGADVHVLLEAGEMLPSEDLVEKARQAQASDMALVLFSPASLPSPWPRSAWEDALVKEPAAEGLRIAFVRCGDCVPPRVLTPMFESNALRAIKRWVRGHAVPARAGLQRDADLEVLGMAIADQPGTESVANQAMAERFVDAFENDFDAVLRVDGGRRSLAAITGDLASQLGLRLEGEAEENLARLLDFCAARRFLMVLRDFQTPNFTFSGRTSTLFVEAVVAEPEDDSIRGIQHKLRQAQADWTEFCRLARLGRRLTRDAGRVAEYFEMMQTWFAAAEARRDRAVMDESARELVWILDSWDRCEEARELDYRRATEAEDQMLLPFQ